MRNGRRVKPRKRLRPQRLIWACALAAVFCAMASMFAPGATSPTQLPQESEVFVPEATTTLLAHTEYHIPLSSEAPTLEPVVVPDPWTQEELEAMVQTLTGECYDDKPDDKRKVCEVILNRVSAGRYGPDIISVITAKSQFLGYWNPSRESSENDYEIARQALADWFAGDCAPLSEYLYFTAGPNRENVFRKTY